MIAKDKPIRFNIAGVRNMKKRMKVGDKITIMRMVKRDTDRGVRTYEEEVCAEVKKLYPNIVHTDKGDADYISVTLLNPHLYDDANYMAE